MTCTLGKILFYSILFAPLRTVFKIKVVILEQTRHSYLWPWEMLCVCVCVCGGGGGGGGGGVVGGGG